MDALKVRGRNGTVAGMLFPHFVFIKKMCRQRGQKKRQKKRCRSRNGNFD